MGQLHYGSPPASFEIDDRTLAHVELVTMAKLRRSEGFVLSIDSAEGGRSSIWLNAASTVRFELTVARPEISRELLDEFMDAANTAAGLSVPVAVAS